MNQFIFLQITVILIVVATIHGHSSESSNESNSSGAKNDDTDFDAIIGNQRILTNYVNCLSNQGRCSPDQQAFKGTFRDAISNGCDNCSENQKNGCRKMMHHMIDNAPDQWAKLERIYDPSENYRNNYLASKS